MRDRKIFYILFLVAVIGSAVTLGTGYLTGTFGRPSQVTVTLAGTAADEETDSAAYPGVLPAQREIMPGAAPSEPVEPAEPEDGPVTVTTAAMIVGPGGVGDIGPGKLSAGEPGAVEDTAPSEPQDNGPEVQEADAIAPVSAEENTADAAPQESVLTEGVSIQEAGMEAEIYGTAEISAALSDDGGAFSAADDNPYLKRLNELDVQIRKNQKVQADSGSSGAGSGNTLAKNAASDELKMWDSELNTVYNEILKHLDEQQAQELVASERQWMKNRDADAVEAAKNSAGGSLESVEYTASLASSTRARAYELVSLYGSVLTEQK